MFLPVFFTLSILISQSAANTVYDFCVADMSQPHGPTGYACKDWKTVTINDFVSSGLLGVRGNTSNLLKTDVRAVTPAKLPGLNGLGVSMARIDMDVGGVGAIHTHRVSEVVFVVEGTTVAGYIDSNNRAYYKTLNKGDLMIFPKTTMHFLYNVGSTPMLAYSVYSGETPGLQFVHSALFQGNLPPELLQKISLLDAPQLQKLKKLFGGTN